MAYATPTTRAAGYVVPYTVWNSDVVDNVIALRTGAIALTSQAAGDVIYATSSTQFGRVAIGTSGYVLTSNGTVPTWSNTPTITGTNFSSIPETAITDGSLLARVGGNETISGTWSYTVAPRPTSNDGAALGVAGTAWSDLFLATGGVVNWGNGNVTQTHAAGAMAWAGSTNSTVNFDFTNSNTGASANVVFRVFNGTNDSLVFRVYSSTHATNAGEVEVDANRSGGLVLKASDASGTVRIAAGGTTERMRVGTTGDIGIAAAKKFYYDGVTLAGNTYSYEESTDTLVDVVGGVKTFERTAGAIKVLGTEGGAATIHLWADEGDDSTDKWSLSVADAGASEGRLVFAYDGSTRVTFGSSGSALPRIVLANGDYGTGSTTGPVLSLGVNTSSSRAAGVLHFTTNALASRYVWVDGSGDMRIHSAQPTADNSTVADTAGTVVGTQTSQRVTKNIYGEFTRNADALALLTNTPVFEFDYKSGAYNGQRFIGITTDDSPEFGMDLGRSFNPVTAFGYTVAAFKALTARVAALEARCAA